MDIVVLGRGVIGLTLASLLEKQTEHNITVVSPSKHEAARYSALTYASKNIFTYLGIWEEVLNSDVGMYHKMHLYDAKTQAAIDIDAYEFGASELGHIVNNKLLSDVLYRRLQDTRVNFIDGFATELAHGIQKSKFLVNDQMLSADLLLGADGGNSWLRKSLDIPSYNYSYQHNALVATVELHSEHYNTAKQIFYPAGPLAFLPLSTPNMCSIVWSTNPEHAQTLMQMTEEEFAEEINVAALHSKRFCFPLNMKHVTQYVGSNWALLGDAAHVIHPLAGQGMNLGLLDAATLAEKLQNASLNNLYNYLRAYERARKGYNWGMIGLMEFCKRTFGSKNKAFNTVRSVGMHALNKFMPAKNLISKIGMGVYGELPLSARGYL